MKANAIADLVLFVKCPSCDNKINLYDYFKDEDWQNDIVKEVYFGFMDKVGIHEDCTCTKCEKKFTIEYAI